MRCTVFSALVGLVTALPSPVIDRQVAPTSTITVTADAHPLTFWPLTHLPPDATPLTYGNPPTASRVPPPLSNPSEKRNILPAPSSPSSSSSCEENQTPTPIPTTIATTPTIATATTTCTIFRGANPTSTLPAFCRPTLFANAPHLAVPSNPEVAAATAVVTMSANSVSDKVSCCAYCAAYYNCYAWHFVPSYVGTPSGQLPGGFDPWRHGNCEIAYYTGNGTSGGTGSEGGDEEGGDGDDAAVTREGAADICPNGRLKGVLDSSGNVEGGSDAWFNGLYYNGWNQGACADLGSVIYAAGRDLGVGDGSRVCV